MRLVDFVFLLLKAHAEILQKLALFFGEERFFEILEASEDQIQEQARPFSLHSDWFAVDPHANPTSAYAELEGGVHELRLPEFLEFHLWAYPFYRIFIESSYPLTSKIQSRPENALEILVEESLQQANAWTRALQIPSPLIPQVDQIVQATMIRFRTSALKKAGFRPIASI